MFNLSFVRLTAVDRTTEDKVYVASMVFKNEDGTEVSGTYGSRPGDTYGMAVEVRAAITEWIAAGKSVGTWKPPT
ncbi:hypothetical protein GOZ94_00460 [Agrobacterium vitis]|uniref:hypothetical protein n=1 Tax=Agrobacterium vitis TaxID=373 RepID=UPI0012E82067|nr:hypothetical protein [Agrobacterium vitis]MVA17416.1 hypothetical protein [Agrobacterium vitis]